MTEKQYVAQKVNFVNPETSARPKIQREDFGVEWTDLYIKREAARRKYEAAQWRLDQYDKQYDWTDEQKASWAAIEAAQEEITAP